MAIDMKERIRKVNERNKRQAQAYANKTGKSVRYTKVGDGVGKKETITPSKPTQNTGWQYVGDSSLGTPIYERMVNGQIQRVATTDPTGYGRGGTVEKPAPTFKPATKISGLPKWKQEAYRRNVISEQARSQGIAPKDYPEYQRITQQVKTQNVPLMSTTQKLTESPKAEKIPITSTITPTETATRKSQEQLAGEKYLAELDKNKSFYQISPLKYVFRKARDYLEIPQPEENEQKGIIQRIKEKRTGYEDLNKEEFLGKQLLTQKNIVENVEKEQIKKSNERLQEIKGVLQQKVDQGDISVKDANLILIGSSGFESIRATSISRKQIKETLPVVLREKNLIDYGLYKDSLIEKNISKDPQYAFKLSMGATPQQIKEQERRQNIGTIALFTGGVPLLLGYASAETFAKGTLKIGEETSTDKTIFENYPEVSYVTRNAIAQETAVVRGKAFNYIKDVVTGTDKPLKRVAKSFLLPAVVIGGVVMPELGASRLIAGDREVYKQSVEQSLKNLGYEDQKLKDYTESITRQKYFSAVAETGSAIISSIGTEVASRRMITDVFIKNMGTEFTPKQLEKAVKPTFTRLGVGEALAVSQSVGTATYNPPSTGELALIGTIGGISARYAGAKIVSRQAFGQKGRQKLTEAVAYSFDPEEYVADQIVSLQQKIKRQLGSTVIDPVTVFDKKTQKVLTSFMLSRKVGTATPTITPSVTPTVSLTPQQLANVRISSLKINTPTITQTATPTLNLNQISPTITLTPTTTILPSPTITPSITPITTPTITPSVTPTATLTPSITTTSTTSITTTPTVTPTVTPSVTLSPTITPTVTPDLYIPNFWGGGGYTKKRKRKTKDPLYYTESFTARILGLDPLKVSKKQAKKLLQTPLTGFEIRRGIIIK